MSPPADDHERLSKQEDDSKSDSHEEMSSEGELPRDDVPELHSEEDEEEADTREMQDAARRAMQGSFLPIMAILETQLADKPDPNMTIDADQGLVLLHSAAFYGKIKPVRALIEKYHADATMPDYRGQTPLHIATVSGNLEVAVYLADKLKKKEAINVRDNSLMTPLMNCIISNNEHAFIYLYFKARSSLNNVDMNGNTLLHLAAEHNATNIALILRHLYNVEVKEEVHNNSLSKLRILQRQSIQLHQHGSPNKNEDPLSPDASAKKGGLSLQLTKVEDDIINDDLISDMESEAGDTELFATSYFGVNH